SAVEGSSGAHAVHVAEDLAGDARIPTPPAHPPHLRQVMIGQFVSVEQAAAKDHPEDRLVLHPCDDRADPWEADATDVDSGGAVGSNDAAGVVVEIEGDDPAHAVPELG